MSEIDALLALYDRLSPAEQQTLRQQTAEILRGTLFTPQEGPQTDAYFSEADEIYYGGQAGGGKSAFLIGLAVNEAQNAVIFRNGLKNVADLEAFAKTMLGTDGFNGQQHKFDRGDGRTLEFGSLEQPDSEQDWQGRRRDMMGFDEAAQMLKTRVMFVLGWAGSAKPGTRTRVVYASNPPLSDEGNWLIVWFAPWLDPMFPKPAKPGELRWFVNNKDGDPVWVAGPGRYDRGDGQMSDAKSRTFIRAKLNDNRYLRDTDYRARLEALPEPMRSAMLNGDFLAGRVDHAMQLIPSAWIREAQLRWKENNQFKPMISTGVDVAGGGGDTESIANLHVGNHYSRIKHHQGPDTKDGNKTAGRIVAAMRGGVVGIDMTGGWGGAAITALGNVKVPAISVVFSEKTGAVDEKTKIEFANVRAEMYWQFRDALDPKSGEQIELPPDARVLAEGVAPRWKLQGGKIYIESKEEIRKRLGSSTDWFDAIVIAWHIRKQGLFRLQAGKSGAAQGRRSQVDDGNPFAIDGF